MENKSKVTKENSTCFSKAQRSRCAPTTGSFTIQRQEVF